SDVCSSDLIRSRRSSETVRHGREWLPHSYPRWRLALTTRHREAAAKPRRDSSSNAGRILVRMTAQKDKAADSQKARFCATTIQAQAEACASSGKQHA